MKNNKAKSGKARLFDFRHFPMDLGRIICCTMPLWFRLKKIYVSDAAKEKIKGGALISSNHTCFVDPLILGCSFWYRRMFFLTAEVVMKNPVLRFLLKGIGCVKIDRGICDMQAIRKTVSLLKEGHILSIFPQGGINREEDVKTIKSGIVLMSMQSKVPVIPVFVYRKSKWNERNCIVIGEPIPPIGGENLPAMTDIQRYEDLILNKMTECKALYEKTMKKD